MAFSFLSRLFGTDAKPTTKRSITYQQAGTLAGLVEPASRSGVHVTDSTALGLSALWCGIRTISQDVGTLPMVLYRESEDGTRTPASDHPLYGILHDSPNPEMTRPVCWETMQAHALLFGGMYAEIERDQQGNPLALWPIHPSNIQAERDQQGQLLYRVQLDSTEVELDPADVLHVPGLSPDGHAGYQLLKVARETIGFGIAAMRFGSSWFGNGARPSGVLTTAGQLSDGARDNLRRSWQALHAGTDNAGKVAILEEGLSFSPFLATNEQQQYEQLLRFCVFEVARLLNIPPTKLMSLEKATWANLTELNRDYLTSCLRPWLVKIEAEVERKLLRPDERASLYVEFDTSTLLKADTPTRYASYTTAIGAGFLLVDEVRALENLAPLTQPDDGTDTATDGAAPAIPQEAAVADTALNGAQIASLLEVLAQVTGGQMPLASAVAVIGASFPTLSQQTINDIVGPLETFKPTTTTEASNGNTLAQ